MITQTVDAILNLALAGGDLSPEQGVVLLKQTEPGAVAAIQETADKLRHPTSRRNCHLRD